MALVSLREMLQDARNSHYAVPMFDVSNITMIRTALEVAEEMNSPVILGAIVADIKGTQLEYWSQAAHYAANKARVPVCMHLDHASTYEQCLRCAEVGFSGIMIDASAKTFQENVEMTGKVCKEMKRRGISVEAELGHVPTTELGYGESSDMNTDTESIFTKPDDVVKFIDLTGADALAVSIGTSHGVYKSAPKLDIERLKEINAVSEVPLVLHGGSGTPEDQMQKAIENGISKVNIYSDITKAWNTAMLNFLKTRENMSCWMSVAWKEPEEAVRKVMRDKILQFHSNR
ncbi:MAG: class II fructose-bisphosphate aldolase [Lentisphaeria bacterium]